MMASIKRQDIFLVNFDPIDLTGAFSTVNFALHLFLFSTMECE
jgi:hypothetical protein